MTRVPNVAKVVQSISNLNHIYNEQVTLHYLTRTVCTTCGLDPVTQTGLNALCPTCSGTGYTTADTSLVIPASVEQNDPFAYEILPVGTILSGEIWVIIDSQEITAYNIDPMKVDYWEWGGNKYRLVEYMPQYLQGTLYEYDVKLSKITRPPNA